MVVFVTLLETTQDADGIHLVRLLYQHGLEPPFERLVFLEVFLVLTKGCGTDGTKFATRQGRLEDVGSIHRALAASGTHQRVDFVDEEDDVALGAHYLLNYAFEPLLKLALVLGAGYQCTHIK